MTGLDRWIGHWAEHRPDHPAIVFDGDVVTYAELLGRVGRLAVRLAGHGVVAGDRVAFCGLNRPELIEALAACARLGAVLVPLNNRLTAGELGYQLGDAEPRLALVTDGFGDLVGSAAAGRVPIVDLDGEPLDGESIDGGPAVDRAVPVEPAVPVGPGDHPTLMVYTSGTTGRPKGAVHTTGSLLHTVLNGVAHQDLTGDDTILTLLPLFHVGGLNIQTLPALYVGATVVLQRRFDPGETLQLIDRHRPTQTLLVPAVMTALLDHPDLDRTDLQCLRGINSGSSVVPDHLIRGFLDRGVPVGQVYGSTETGPTAVVLRYDDGAANIGSCGRPALHTEVRLVDRDGIDVGDGEAGELLVRGPNLFDHYHGRPDDTAAAFSAGWYHTGDIARRDDGGWIHIEDRLGDVLISGGENVYPAEVENTLAEHPDIAAVAVVGRPDARWGEVPVAVIEAADGAGPAVDELRAWCRDRLARFKQPREVVVVDELPRTALGKVTKHVLRAQLAGHTGDGVD
ncbi:MAG: long-chain fatty acid--CoA ligase [Actinomycetota bacterium]